MPAPDPHRPGRRSSKHTHAISSRRHGDGEAKHNSSNNSAPKRAEMAYSTGPWCEYSRRPGIRHSIFSGQVGPRPGFRSGGVSRHHLWCEGGTQPLRGSAAGVRDRCGGAWSLVADRRHLPGRPTVRAGRLGLCRLGPLGHPAAAGHASLLPRRRLCERGVLAGSPGAGRGLAVLGPGPCRAPAVAYGDVRGGVRVRRRGGPNCGRGFRRAGPGGLAGGTAPVVPAGLPASDRPDPLLHAAHRRWGSQCLR